MKKLAILFAAVMVFAIAVPSLAAVDVSGTVSADVWYDQFDGFYAVGNVDSTVDVTAGAEADGWKLSAKFGALGSLDADKAFGTNAFGQEDTTFSFKVKSVLLENTGAYWVGGPELTTKIGNVDATYSDLVAAFGSHEQADTNSDKLEGFELSGLDLGGLTTAVYYAWPTVTGLGPVLGLNAATDVEGVSLSAAVASYNKKSDFSIEAAADVADGLSVDAAYALDGHNSDSYYKVGAEVSSIEALTLNGSVWSAGAGFLPAYAEWNADDDEYTTIITDEKGFSIGGSTTQAGVELGVTYESTTDAAGGSAQTTTTITGATTVVDDLKLDAKVKLQNGVTTETTTTITLAKSFGDVNASYELENKQQAGTTTHTIAADTKIASMLSEEVTLAGEVTLASGTTSAKTTADWTAPNGLGVQVGWANDLYDDLGPVDDNGADFSSNAQTQEGFWVNVSKSVDF